jgi:hypothetical protein
VAICLEVYRPQLVKLMRGDAMGAPIGCREKADLQRLTDLSQQKDPAF